MVLQVFNELDGAKEQRAIQPVRRHLALQPGQGGVVGGADLFGA